MSNMRKSFETKAKLRRMADGGIFKNIVNGVQTFTDERAKTAGAQPYTPRAFRDLPNQGITTGGVTTPLPAGVAPAPVLSAAPPMPAPAKLSVAPPLPAPPPAAKISPMPIGPRSNYLAATGGFGPTQAPAAPAQTTYQKAGGVSGDSPVPRRMGAMGLPLMTSVGYASGGEVKGPGGPTDDKVGPVMLSDGEYVLPADTVRKVGKENLDALKDATHTPVSVKQRRGLRRMADGTPTEEQKRAAMLRAAAQTAAGPTAAMVATGTPNAQPMPPQRPSEVLSGNVDLGVMRNDGVPPPPPAAPKLAQVPRTVLMGPGEALIRGITGDAVLGTTSKPPTQTPAAPATEKLAPAPVRGPDGKFPGDATAPAAAPVGAVAPAEPITSLRSLKLEQMGVSQGDQLNPVYEMKQSALPDAPQVGATVTPSAFASPGAKQLNSKYYQGANGAVLEGTAPASVPASVAAGPKTLGDPNGAPTAWRDVPRTYRSDTIRQGVEPGVQMNLGDGIFATSSGLNKDGRLDTFTGVGKDYNADSARFGPDPNGADRARQDAIVEQNLQAKPREQRGPRMPEFRSNERDINARFDQLAKEAQRNFSSPRAAGNLTKALERIEASRMQALSQDADNITRQQQAAMQFQSDQSRDALTERDLSQRAAQAARADETDRLGIEAQNARAAETAAATGAFRATKLENEQYALETRGMEYPPSKEEWLAGRRSGGTDGYTNSKDLERFSKRITDQATKAYGPGTPGEDIAKQQAIIANPQLLYGQPDQAVITHAEPLKYLVDYFGIPNIGVPVRNEKGSYEWEAPAGERFASASGPWDSSKALLGGKVYKFVGPDKKERYLRIGQGGDAVQRLIEGYFAMKDPPKERN